MASCQYDFVQIAITAHASLRNSAGISATPRYTSDAIEAVVGTLLKNTGPIQATIETLDLWVVSDVAYETRKWRYVYTPPGKAAQTVTGCYVTNWKRQPDGSWRISADISVPGTAWKD